METIIFILITASIIALLLFADVDAGISYRDELIIEFDYLLIKLIIYPERNKEEISNRSEDKPLTRLKKKLIRIYSTRKALETLLRHAEITIYEIDLLQKSAAPENRAIRAQNALSVIYAIITYLDVKAQSLIAKDTNFIAFEDEEQAKTTIDISLKFNLYRFILALIIYLYEMKKRNKKRRKNNV